MPDFPISLLNAPTFDGELPAKVDVVVIGGGIIGVLAAWELRKRGNQVLLAEKGRIGGEQSGRNWGWIRQQGRDYAELPIMIDANRIWKEFDERLKEKIGFRQCGITYLARSRRRLGDLEAWLEGAKGYGVDSRLLSLRQTQDLLSSSRTWIGALTTPSDAMAEPFVTTPVLASAAAAAGVAIRENCAVRVLDCKNGSVEGVFTEKGYVKCDRVAVTAGAWSALFLVQHGVRIPQLSVVASVLSTQPMRGFFNAAAADDRIAFRRRADGGYSLASWEGHDFFIGPDAFRHFVAYLPQLRREFANTRFRPAAPANYPDAWQVQRRWKAEDKSPFERCRILDPLPNRRELGRVIRHLKEAFPGIGQVQVRQAWAGMIDTMPDELPIVDNGPIGGLTIATGMSGHGFGIAPGMARVVADLAESRQLKYEMRPFSFRRFL